MARAVVARAVVARAVVARAVVAGAVVGAGRLMSAVCARTERIAGAVVGAAATRAVRLSSLLGRAEEGVEEARRLLAAVGPPRRTPLALSRVALSIAALSHLARVHLPQRVGDGGGWRRRLGVWRRRRRHLLPRRRASIVELGLLELLGDEAHRLLAADKVWVARVEIGKLHVDERTNHLGGGRCEFVELLDGAVEDALPQLCEALELRRQARGDHPLELCEHLLDHLHAVGPEERNLPPGEHVEGLVGDEERSARPGRLPYRVRDVRVREAFTRVERRESVRELSQKDGLDTGAPEEVVFLTRGLLGVESRRENRVVHVCTKNGVWQERRRTGGCVRDWLCERLAV